MVSNFLKCCFPSSNDSIINKKEFNDVSSRSDLVNQVTKAKFGNNFTMIDDKEKFKENGQMSNNKVIQIIPNENVSNNNVLMKSQIKSNTIILDRLRLYNESKDAEIFKSKVNNLIQNRTLNDNSVINKLRTKSVRIN